jgi:hypothetical protein
MKLQVLGIDLGKTVFHLVGVDSTGRVVIRKRCSRTQLLAFTANLQVQLIGMEACSGAPFLGRALRGQGHEVRLIPAQYATVVEVFSSSSLDKGRVFGKASVLDCMAALPKSPAVNNAITASLPAKVTDHFQSAFTSGRIVRCSVQLCPHLCAKIVSP